MIMVNRLVETERGMDDKETSNPNAVKTEYPN